MANLPEYPCYYADKDNRGHWYWIYYAKNGKAIARSSESYVAKADCDHSIQLLKGSSNDPYYYNG